MAAQKEEALNLNDAGLGMEEFARDENPGRDRRGKKGAGVDEDDAVVADNIEFILDIPLDITVELGRTRMLIHELLKLGQGSVIELGKSSGASLDILANQRLIARGEVVEINDKYGIRLTEIISPMERVEKLR
jgi:flagellar motor switch protein FliN